MTYLHDSPLRCHGNLCTANCLIDSRWVVKLSDFGLYAFKKGSGPTANGCESSGNNNNLHDNNEMYEEDMMIPVRRGSTDSKKITVKYESEYLHFAFSLTQDYHTDSLTDSFRAFV